MAPESERRARFDIARWLLQILPFAAVYFASARFGLLMAFGHRNVSPVWPPSGVALAGLLLFGIRMWPAVTLGAFLANFTTGLPLLTACAIATGNTLEAVLGAWLLGRVPGFGRSLGRLRDVVALLILAAMGSTTVAATVGVASLALARLVDRSGWGAAWVTWWVGDGMGMLVVAPVLLTWTARPRTAVVLRWPAGRVAELLALAALLIGVCRFIFDGGRDYPYAVFPFVIWAAVRFGSRGAATANLAVSGMAVWGTLRGLGPFVRASPEQSLIFLQTFMCIVSVTGLLLAAAIVERRQSELRFRQLAENIREVFWMADPESHSILYVSPAYEEVWGRSCASLYRDPRSFLEAVHLEDRERAAAKLEQQARGQRTSEEYRLVRTDGSVRWIWDRGFPILDANGKVFRVAGIAEDITERKLHEQETAALNARLQWAMIETHHRVKNNLQIIAAMVDMQVMEDAETLPTVQVKQLGSHVRTLAAVHEILTHDARCNGDVLTVSVREILERLLPLVRDMAAARRIRWNVEDTRLPVQQGTSLALVANELLCNAIKHGRGDVAVRFTCAGGQAVLTVSDEGPGFPPGFDPAASMHTGLNLVANLSRWDLGGQSTFENRPEGGAQAVVTMPLQRFSDSRL